VTVKYINRGGGSLGCLCGAMEHRGGKGRTEGNRLVDSEKKGISDEKNRGERNF